MQAAHSHRFILLIMGLTLHALTSPVFAQSNALTNSGFDTDLSGWDVLQNRTADWSELDANNSMESGSALVANEGTSNGAVPLVLTQCVPALPEAEYVFGGKLLVPSGQPAETEAFIFLDTYLSADCSGSPRDTEDESAMSVDEWENQAGMVITDSGVQSISISLGVLKPSGVSTLARAHFDDVFVRQVGGGGGGGDFVIGPSMSASWFNPDESGHGIMIHLINETQAWMCWFTFDLMGNPAWICAVGTISGDTITFTDAFTVEGGAFPPMFDPTQIAEVPWGSITVVFTGCDTGTMTWTTTAAGFQSGSMPLVRLTTLWGNVCI